ncbi:MAG: hypothetical protein A2261_00940 [Candidatus Magasanikbacteria bacterium RIFOXYA2_FULL_44_8]|uniref:SCP domain-containing protein n=1 Tax=Candidatus Magasanikbacteria bacterium RIFOXYA2_FULL_44_8 TaxID=1798696 RepID=A0A1F6NJR9_9BACT|nr:MAG: hypothetical protein A2261_00940 [Candidatus Magasanikbacteria bacterium RIFOXYA2_FULL_44_8]
MRRTLKKYFIPHRENDYHPHILHTKRAWFYGGVFSVAKIIVVGCALLLPNKVFVLPDVLASEENKLMILTNEFRQANGVSTLHTSDRLIVSSADKAGDMARTGYFSHEGIQNNLRDWLSLAGYDYSAAGENLAVGFAGAEEIMRAWQASPTHRANLLDKDFQDIGIGMADGMRDDRPTVFVAQHFGAPSSGGMLSAQMSQISPAGELSGQAKFSPLQKYFLAKSTLSPITSIFDVSQKFYFFAIMFFVFALLLNIVIEVRKQHPHVIFQTAGLISLLICFWLY